MTSNLWPLLWYRHLFLFDFSIEIHFVLSIFFFLYLMTRNEFDSDSNFDIKTHTHTRNIQVKDLLNWMYHKINCKIYHRLLSKTFIIYWYWTWITIAYHKSIIEHLRAWIHWKYWLYMRIKSMSLNRKHFVD